MFATRYTCTRFSSWILKDSLIKIGKFCRFCNIPICGDCAAVNSTAWWYQTMFRAISNPRFRYSIFTGLRLNKCPNANHGALFTFWNETSARNDSSLVYEFVHKKNTLRKHSKKKTSGKNFKAMNRAINQIQALPIYDMRSVLVLAMFLLIADSNKWKARELSSTS